MAPPPQTAVAPPEADNRNAAREVIFILDEIASLMNVKIPVELLSYCVSLIENGVSPEALAVIIRELWTKFPPPPDDEMGGGE